MSRLWRVLRGLICGNLGQFFPSSEHYCILSRHFVQDGLFVLIFCETFFRPRSNFSTALHTAYQQTSYLSILVHHCIIQTCKNTPKVRKFTTPQKVLFRGLSAIFLKLQHQEIIRHDFPLHLLHFHSICGCFEYKQDGH